MATSSSPSLPPLNCLCYRRFKVGGEGGREGDKRDTSSTRSVMVGVNCSPYKLPVHAYSLQHSSTAEIAIANFQLNEL